MPATVPLDPGHTCRPCEAVFVCLFPPMNAKIHQLSVQPEIWEDADPAISVNVDKNDSAVGQGPECGFGVDHVDHRDPNRYSFGLGRSRAPEWGLKTGQGAAPGEASEKAPPPCRRELGEKQNVVRR